MVCQGGEQEAAKETGDSEKTEAQTEQKLENREQNKQPLDISKNNQSAIYGKYLIRKHALMP